MKKETMKKKMYKRLSTRLLPCVVFLVIVTGGVSTRAFGQVPPPEVRRCVAFERIQPNLYIVTYRNGKMAAIDSTGTRIGAKYSEIETYWRPCKAFPVEQHKRYGLISALTGQELVPCQYAEIWGEDTVHGLCACLTKEDMLGFLDAHTGNVVIPFRFHFDRVAYWDSPADLKFRDNVVTIPVDEGWLVVDTSGKVLIGPVDDVEREENGLLRVYEQGKYALYDLKGFRRLLAGMDDIVCTNVGVICYDGKSQYLLDPACTHVLCTWVTNINYEYQEDGLLPLTEWQSDTVSPYKIFFQNGNMGVYDKDYKVIINPEWDRIRYLSDGYFECITDDHVFILDRNGRMVHSGQ